MSKKEKEIEMVSMCIDCKNRIHIKKKDQTVTGTISNSGYAKGFIGDYNGCKVHPGFNFMTFINDDGEKVPDVKECIFHKK